jgi:outer membrane protein assembly factor BamE (lipoprotein component of BamABCDE complex)
MRRWLSILSLAATALLACSPVLRSPVPAAPEHLDLRTRYFALHPEDPFRAAIEADELRTGMSPTQVYLAWGRPLERVKSERTQRWLYEFREPNPGEGQPAVVARLFFEDGLLVAWQRDRHTVDFRQRAGDPDPLADLRDLPTLDTGKSREP